MKKRAFSLALLLATAATIPAYADLPATIDQIIPTSALICPSEVPCFHELAAATQQTFTLIDPQSHAKVETYRLQPGWSGFGSVSLNRDISGANMVTWFSGFNHSSGAKAYCDSQRVANVPTAFSNSGYVKNNAQMANQVAQLVAQRAHANKVKTTSFKVTACNDPQVNNLAAGFRQQYGAQSNVMTRVVLGEFSFTKNGQPWQAQIRIPLLISEAKLMGGMYGTMVIHLYQEMYIYPVSQKKNCLSAARAIIKTRTPNQDWENNVAQLRTNVSTGAINSARKQSDIWRQTGEDISNMNRDSYNKRNASQDRLSQKRSDATLGNVTAVDPFNSGHKITVKDNADYIWVNEDGEQCGSNNSNYNPNQDPRRNDAEWRRIRK